MTKVCVITYLYGGYDNLNDVVQSVDADYYCFTDNILLQSKTWKIIYEPYNNLVKYFKDKLSVNENLKSLMRVTISKYVNFYIEQKYDYYVKVDANVKIINKDLIKNCIELLKSNNAEILYSKHLLGSFTNDLTLSKKMSVYQNINFEKLLNDMNEQCKLYNKNLDKMHIWNGFSIMTYECYKKMDLNELMYINYKKYTLKGFYTRPQGQLFEYLYILEKKIKFILIQNILGDKINTYVCEHIKKRV